MWQIQGIGQFTVCYVKFLSRHEDGLSCQHGIKPPLTYSLVVIDMYSLKGDTNLAVP